MKKTKKDDRYKELIHDNMTIGELSILGNIILYDKIQRLKHKLFGWYYERKTKKQDKKKV